MKHKLGAAANYTVAASLFILAHIYLIKPSFMPYHSQALGLSWHELDKATQTLVLALMRVCGGGWLAVAIAIITLQWKFTGSRESWIPPAILVTGLISVLATLYATLLVFLNTAGSPPIPGLLVLMLLLFVGYYYNVAAVKKYKLA